jgi:hypothetical protein
MDEIPIAVHAVFDLELPAARNVAIAIAVRLGPLISI